MDEERPKLVVESSLMEQVWYQIDRYLQKKWPDVFVQDELKKMKEQIEQGMARLKEDEKRIRLYRERELKIDSTIFDFNYRFLVIERNIKELQKKFSYFSCKEDRKWWQFWKTVIVLHETKQEDDE